MDELKRMLERRAQEMRLDEDFPSKIRTRARRRRLGTAILSLTVVAAIGTSSFVAVHELMERRSRLGPQPATSPTSGVRPVWPSVEEILQIQDMVTRDHATWALTPKGIGQIFAERVMRWNPPDVEIVPRNELPAHAALLDRREFLPIRNERLAEETGLSEAPITWLRLHELPGDPPVYAVTHITSDAIVLVSPVPTFVPTDQEEVPFSARLTVDPGTVSVAFALHPSRLGTSPSRSEFQSQPDQLVEDTLISIGNTRIASATISNLKRVPLAMTAIAFESAPAIQIAELHDEAAPVPGPTPTSDDRTPAAVRVELSNASSNPRLPDFIASLIQVRGRGVHHGGYQLVASEETGGSAATAVLYQPGYESEARRLATRLFFGSSARPDTRPTGAPLRVVAGEDTLDRYLDELNAFSFVRLFGTARTDGSGAESFLSPPALEYYQRASDASLYGYAEGCPTQVWVSERTLVTGYEFYLAICRPHADSWTERLRVEVDDDDLQIVDARLVTVTTSR